MELACLMWLGRGFQREGAATEKALSPQVWCFVLMVFCVEVMCGGVAREEVGEVRRGRVV